jgi:hypothetical protein
VQHVAIEQRHRALVSAAERACPLNDQFEYRLCIAWRA